MLRSGERRRWWGLCLSQKEKEFCLWQQLWAFFGNLLANRLSGPLEMPGGRHACYYSFRKFSPPGSCIACSYIHSQFSNTHICVCTLSKQGIILGPPRNLRGDQFHYHINKPCVLYVCALCVFVLCVWAACACVSVFIFMYGVSSMCWSCVCVIRCQHERRVLVSLCVYMGSVKLLFVYLSLSFSLSVCVSVLARRRHVNRDNGEAERIAQNALTNFRMATFSSKRLQFYTTKQERAFKLRAPVLSCTCRSIIVANNSAICAIK